MSQCLVISQHAELRAPGVSLCAGLRSCQGDQWLPEAARVSSVCVHTHWYAQVHVLVSLGARFLQAMSPVALLRSRAT